MMPAPGLAGDGGGDEQQAQQQHRQAQAVALRLRPRVPAPQAQAEAQGDDAGQRLGRHPRQRPRLGARVFERFAGVGVGDGGKHQGAVRRRVVEFEQVGAGGAVGDEEQGVGAGGQRLQASPPRRGRGVEQHQQGGQGENEHLQDAFAVEAGDHRRGHGEGAECERPEEERSGGRGWGRGGFGRRGGQGDEGRLAGGG